MAPARSFIAEIPALRRFSRALIGHSSRADSYLETALSDLLAEPPARSPSTWAEHPQGLRLYLLKCFLESLPARLEEADPCDGCAMEKATQSVLHRVALRPRIAFLLRTLEELCDDDIAYVMGVSTLQARLLTELGSASIASEIATRVLIIDSNADTVSKLESLIEELGHTSCGKAQSLSDALTLVAQERPGLIITELSFSDGSSNFAIINKFLNDYNIPVIIITETPELLKNETSVSPIGIITRPFLIDTVRATICKALFFKKRPNYPYGDYDYSNQVTH